MAGTFLGKSIPNHRPPIIPFKRRRPSFWLFYLGPFILILSFVYLNFDLKPYPTTQSPPPSFSRTLAVSGFRYINPCLLKYNNGDKTEVGKAFNTTNLFPILPYEILGKKYTDPRENPPMEKQCTPADWTFDIYIILAWKFLKILNWLAGTLAILLTIYAGLLYLGGLANEGNIKKAKSILMATYLGLVLVIMARFILYGTIAIFSNRVINPDTIKTEIDLPD